MNTILRDLSIIWTLLHCVIMFMFLYESRFTSKKTNILTALFVVPLVALNLGNVILLGIEKAGQLVIFCCVLPSLLFFFWMAKNRGYRFLFTFCLVDTIVLEVLFATNLLDTYFGFGNYALMFITRLISLPLLEYGLVKYLRRPYRLLQQQMPKGWGVFSIMAAFFYLALIITTYHPTIILDRPEYISHLVLLLIAVPIMYMVIFKVLWAQLQLFEAAEKNRALDMQVKMVTERLDSNTEAEHNLQTLRHDMKHKMLLLNDYIRNQKLAEAEQYINSMIADIDRSPLKSYCDNNAANVVLSYYNKIADEKDIEFITSMRLPAQLVIKEIDLAVILSNGLENAINALENCDEKKIIIKSFIEADKLYLEIKNPFNSSIAFEGKIPRSKKANHGYGTKSMAAIVEKYDGVYSFSVENGYFSFRCSI